MNLEILIREIKNIILEASKICKEDFTIEIKGNLDNIVTSSDVAIERFLHSKLSSLIPNSSFYMEENIDVVLKENSDYLWIIDPIDGTENYSRNIKDYAISVALAYKNEIILGVVYLPKTNELFEAIKGKGAYLNNKKISVSKRNFNESLIATAFSLYKKEYANKCFDILKEIYPNIKDFRRFGSCACELCYLAKGEIDLYFEIRVFLWDYAASLIILKEAGGFISGNNKKPLILDKITPLIATNNENNFNKLNEIVYKHLGDNLYE